METLLNEQELVERSRRGDLEAFNRIVLAYQDRVYSLCLRMVGSRQAAEDAAQETFLSAYRNVRRMRGPNLRAWLLRIASNTCVDELRRRRRRPQVSLDATAPDAESGTPMDVADPAAGPESLALQGEIGEALQAELLRLPPDQRLTVILCDIEGLSYDEIAASMGSSTGTVKSRFSRGRARLRELVRKRPELFGDLVRHTSGSRYADVEG